MSKWLLVIVLGVQAHFGASFLVPLARDDQGAFGGLLMWAWPWSATDNGPLGRVTEVPFVAFVIAMSAACLSILALLALLGVWIPQGWWKALAASGAILVIAVMLLFFGPTKVLPIMLGLFVLGIVFGVVDWRVAGSVGIGGVEP